MVRILHDSDLLTERRPAPAGEYTVLVVEDDDLDFERVRRYLETASLEFRSSFRLEWSSSFDDALALLRRSSPDVVLLDLHLPDKEGLGAVRTMLAQAPDAAIVVLTGQDDRSRALEAIRIGADDYLLKDELTPDLLRRSLLFSVARGRNRSAERSAARDREERRAAGQLQTDLLPKTTPEIPGYEIAGLYRPANSVGGDLYDFLTMPNGDLLCHVADVSGHHLESALIMAGLRRVVRSLSPRLPDLRELFDAVNEAVHEDTGDVQFVTQFLVRLEPAARRFEYVGAGQVGYVLRATGEWVRLDSHIPPLGMRKVLPDFSPTTVTVEPGDVVVLPTDGFVEAANVDGELWRVDRLERTIRAHRDRPAREMAAGLLGAIREYCQPHEPEDDCTLVIIKVRE